MKLQRSERERVAYLRGKLAKPSKISPIFVKQMLKQITEGNGQIQVLPEQEDGVAEIETKPEHVDQKLDYDEMELEERYGMLRPSALHA